MNRTSFLRRLAMFFSIVILGLMVSLPRPARAADFTDLWFDRDESGWGVNIVQSDTFLFVTFFIYGKGNSPTWYTAQLTANGQGAYTGGLYLTQGTYYALPWNPADHPAAQQVGTATFTPNNLNVYQATLSYTVDNVAAAKASATITKSIERQTLTTITIGGTYVGGQSGLYSNCSNSTQNGSYIDTFELQVTQKTDGSATLVFTYQNNLSCTLSGTLEQHGQLYRIPGASYVCTQNNQQVLNTTATLYEMKATALGFEGRLSATDVGGKCQESAQFAGALE